MCLSIQFSLFFFALLCGAYGLHFMINASECLLIHELFFLSRFLRAFHVFFITLAIRGLYLMFLFAISNKVLPDPFLQCSTVNKLKREIDKSTNFSINQFPERYENRVQRIYSFLLYTISTPSCYSAGRVIYVILCPFVFVRLNWFLCAPFNSKQWKKNQHLIEFIHNIEWNVKVVQWNPIIVCVEMSGSIVSVQLVS